MTENARAVKEFLEENPNSTLQQIERGVRLNRRESRAALDELAEAGEVGDGERTSAGARTFKLGGKLTASASGTQRRAEADRVARGEPPREDTGAPSNTEQRQRAQDQAAERSRDAGDELDGMTVAQLRERARTRDVPGASSMNKQQLIDALRT